MRESQDSLHDLCFKLYAKGLTTRNIESITQEFSEEMGLFRSRPLEDQYSIFYLDAAFISTRRETISKRSLRMRYWAYRRIPPEKCSVSTMHLPSPQPFEATLSWWNAPQKLIQRQDHRLSMGCG